MLFSLHLFSIIVTLINKFLFFSHLHLAGCDIDITFAALAYFAVPLYDLITSRSGPWLNKALLA